MKPTFHDNRLSLEGQFKLQQIALEARDLDAEQLRHCLLAAWSGWMLERQMVNNALEAIEVTIDTRVHGYTPAELCPAAP